MCRLGTKWVRAIRVLVPLALVLCLPAACSDPAGDERVEVVRKSFPTVMMMLRPEVREQLCAEVDSDDLKSRLEQVFEDELRLSDTEVVDEYVEPFRRVLREECDEQ